MRVCVCVHACMLLSLLPSSWFLCWVEVFCPIDLPCPHHIVHMQERLNAAVTILDSEKKSAVAGFETEKAALATELAALKVWRHSAPYVVRQRGHLLHLCFFAAAGEEGVFLTDMQLCTVSHTLCACVCVLYFLTSGGEGCVGQRAGCVAGKHTSSAARRPLLSSLLASNAAMEAFSSA